MGRILAGFHGLSVPEALLQMVRAEQLAGVILFRRNTEGPEQLHALMVQLRQAFAGQLPPLIGVDQEGGLVQRLREPELPVRRFPPMGRLGQELDGAGFEALGLELGRDLARYGFNLNFAPVLDVHTNPANPIIGERAFGRTTEEVITRALPFARGLERAGILWCGKHFPGHGDSDQDSHTALPTLPHDLSRLRDLELKPFAAAAPSAPMMMSAHLIFEPLCPLPATLSPRIIPEILRQEIGFEGVVASDDLEMAAIREHYTVSQIAQGLEAATVDLALVCSDLDFAQELAAALPPNPRAAARLAALRERLPAWLAV